MTGGGRSSIRAIALVALAACHGRDDRGTASAAGSASAPEDPHARAAAEAARREAACHVVIAAVADGTWVGNASGAHRFVARCGRDQDVRAASRELQAFLLAGRDDCMPTVDVGGGAGVDFYDLLAAMDAAHMAGFASSRIGMSGASDLVATFPAAPGAGDRAPADCPPPEAPTDARPAGAPVPLEPPVYGSKASSDEQVTRVVVVSVETETISVNGKPAAAVTASSLGFIPDLARALPPPTADPIVVVVGDRHLDAAIVARVVRTLSASGYKDIRFALAPH